MAPSLEELTAAQPIAQKMVDFINESKSPYHAVGSLKKRLLESGYEQLYEREANWEQKIKPCGKYFFTRNHSTIVAFAVGGQFNGGNSGLKIIGAHTDSPNLVIKPISSQKSSGYLQVGVQTYGGGLWYSWFDRDLTVAGRVILSDGQGKFKQHLVEVKRPILRIPSLAIHLQREVSTEGFKPNTELHLLPIIATELGEMNDDPNAKGFIASHHSVLLKAIAEELKCDVADIRDFDMSIADVQPGVLGGIHNEFVFAPRLDNLASCFVSLEALINSENTLATEKDIRMICLFDHEEVGSTSANGADSSLINDTINRVIQCTHASFDKNAPVDSYGACIANSFIISCDMAHAVHPNYSEKHQAKHRPQIHQGLVIKTNANQRYASNGHTSFLFGELAKRHNIPIQQFVVRNDSACGSTIGPITSANTSIRTIDVGIPQLSMHSIREQCGCIDIKTTIELFTQYFNEFSEIDAKLNVDE